MRFSLRNLILVVALTPCLIWLAWKFEFLHAGWHAGDHYRVNNEPGWVAWVNVANFQVNAVGSPNGPTRYQFNQFWHHPYYHKTIFFEASIPAEHS